MNMRSLPNVDVARNHDVARWEHVLIVKDAIAPEGFHGIQSLDSEPRRRTERWLTRFRFRDPRHSCARFLADGR